MASPRPQTIDDWSCRRGSRSERESKWMTKISLLYIAAVIAAVALFRAPAKTDSASGDSEFVYARVRYHMTPHAIFVREVPCTTIIRTAIKCSRPSWLK